MIQGFNRAKRYAYLRQAYLNDIKDDLDNCVVEDLKYDDSGKSSERQIEYYHALKLLDNKTALEFRSYIQNKRFTRAAILYLVSELGRGFPQTIFVYPYAFESSENEADLLLTIKCHEYRHALDLKYGVPFSNGIIDYTNNPQINHVIKKSLLELRVNEEQIECILNNGQSQRLNIILRNLNQNINILTHYKPKNNFEQKIINYIKEKRDSLVKKLN